MKDSVIAKLACQCEELYNEAYKLCNKESLKQLWDKEWLPLVSIEVPSLFLQMCL